MTEKSKNWLYLALMMMSLWGDWDEVQNILGLKCEILNFVP